MRTAGHMSRRPRTMTSPQRKRPPSNERGLRSVFPTATLLTNSPWWPGRRNCARSGVACCRRWRGRRSFEPEKSATCRVTDGYSRSARPSPVLAGWQKHRVRGFVIDKAGTLLVTSKRVLLIHQGPTSIALDKVVDLEVDEDRQVLTLTRDGRHAVVSDDAGRSQRWRHPCRVWPIADRRHTADAPTAAGSVNVAAPKMSPWLLSAAWDRDGRDADLGGQASTWVVTIIATILAEIPFGGATRPCAVSADGIDFRMSANAWRDMFGLDSRWKP